MYYIFMDNWLLPFLTIGNRAAMLPIQLVQSELQHGLARGSHDPDSRSSWQLMAAGRVSFFLRSAARQTAQTLK